MSSSEKYNDDCNMIRVASELPSLDECYKFVCDDGCGAVATFVGTTRDNFNGKAVKKLSYEGYWLLDLIFLRRFSFLSLLLT